MAIEPDYAAQGGFWEDLFRAWTWCDEQARLHRVDGPAVIHANGCHEWYLHGEWHRVDGPAVIYPDGCSEWYVQNRDITAEVLAWMHDNAITLPFNESQQMEFALRWL
jgi:hypothetical protein